MSDYTIVIHGTGHRKPHENDPIKSTDELLTEFVSELKENGHVVEVATITHGGREKVEAERFCISDFRTKKREASNGLPLSF